MNMHTYRRNPLAILLVTVFLLIPVLASFDPVTPVVFFILGMVNLGIAGKINYITFLKTVFLLSTVGVGLFLLNFLFPAEGINGLHRGITVFLRSISLIGLSIGYIMIVNLYDLTRALMIHLHLPPRLGFALFAGWNVIPLLKRDIQIIKKAQEIRYIKEKKDTKRFLRAAVVLLSGAVRHGERVSLSMASRGIEESQNRSFIRTTEWNIKDTMYCVLGFLVSGTAITVIVISGQFTFGLG